MLVMACIDDSTPCAQKAYFVSSDFLLCNCLHQEGGMCFAKIFSSTMTGRESRHVHGTDRAWFWSHNAQCGGGRSLVVPTRVRLVHVFSSRLVLLGSGLGALFWRRNVLLLEATGVLSAYWFPRGRAAV